MSDIDGNASEPGRGGPVLVEDAESEWLRARNRDPGASPPSPELVREHAELEGMLGNLPATRVDESWHDDVLNAAMQGHRHTTRRRWAAAILAAAAAVVVILLWSPTRPPFEMSIWHPGGPKLGDEAMIGDHLLVRARLEADSDLRVYRDRTALRARCPGGPSCRSRRGAPDEQLIDLTLDLPGQYDVLFVVGAPVTAPEASMDAYLAAAHGANARVVSRQVVVF